MKALGELLVGYIPVSHWFVKVISSNVSAMSEADNILRHELDTLAGTEDIVST